jgi:hypothetical protein
MKIEEHNHKIKKKKKKGENTNIIEKNCYNKKKKLQYIFWSETLSFRLFHKLNVKFTK